MYQDLTIIISSNNESVNKQVYMKQQQQKKAVRRRVKSSRNINKNYSVHTEKPNTLTAERFCLYILMHGTSKPSGREFAV